MPIIRFSSTALVVMLVSICVANAQDSSSGSDEETLEMELVEVTGSRIKRVDIEGPAPVVVMTREDLDLRGYNTVYEALSDLTFANGQVIEGSEFPNGFSPDVQTLNLRTTGVGTTLTLLNGRRIANYPAAYQSNATVFSYSSIPMAAVERIEILSTGASAIYGSDAVAGVINIILRNDINESTVNVLWGTPTETSSSRGDTRLQFVTGKQFDRSGFTATFEYQDRKAVQGKYYENYDNQQDDYPWGQGFYSYGAITWDLVRAAFGEDPENRDPAEIFGTSGQEACDRSNSRFLHAFEPEYGYYCGDPDGGVAERSFRNPRESLSAYFNGYIEVGDNGTEIWSDILLYSAESATPDSSLSIGAEILDLTAPDTVGAGFNDWYRIDRGFTSDELGVNTDRKYEEDAFTAVLGGRGMFRDFHEWEVSASYSDHDYSESKPAFKWREVIDTFFGTHLGTSFFGGDWWSGGTLDESLAFPLGDPGYAYGEINQAVRDALGVSTYENNSKNLSLNVTINGDLWDLPAGRVSYAAIAEYEEIEINYQPDELLRQSPPTTDANGTPIPTALTGSGFWNLTGYAGVGTRERWSVGGELRVPVLETVVVNFAARYDDYDSVSTSFGGDVTPSASIEWRPTDNLMIRAGYTESFRAPDMALVFTETGSYTGATDIINCYEQYVFDNGDDSGFDQGLCRGNTQFVQRVGPQSLGLEAIDAETGHSQWIGFAWNIMDDLSITVDYSESELENRVVSQSAGGLLNDEWACYQGNEPINSPCDQLGKQIFRKSNPLTGVSFVDELYTTSVNQFRSDGQYLDIQLNYRLLTDVGTFGFDGVYSNMLSSTRQISEDSEPLDLRDSPFYAEGSRANFSGSLTWSRDNYNAALTAIYKGGVPGVFCSDFPGGCLNRATGEDLIETGNYRMDSLLTWNLTAAWFFRENMMARLRVQNLLDEAPPDDVTAFRGAVPWYNIFSYSGAALGRYVAIEGEFRF